MPCQPDHLLESIRKETGRPCPRMLLHPKNADAWLLLTMGLDADHQGFVSAFGAGLAAHYAPDAYRQLFARVRAVRSEPRFEVLLEELRERHREEKGEDSRDTSDAWIDEQ